MRPGHPSKDGKPKAGYVAKAEHLLEQLRLWVDPRDDIRAVVVVGSFARGEARPDSDVDVVLLSGDPSVYVEDLTWVSTFGRAEAVDRERHGRVTSIRGRYHDGPEVEFALAPADWASAPFEAGTVEVVRGGIRVLLDRDGQATALASAVADHDNGLLPAH